MASQLDWNRFQNGPVGPESAFESFTCQLFERWVARTRGSEIETYVLNGSGGDGGVEAFATLETGEVVGFQAKWFPRSVGDPEIRQILKSITTALKSHPSLKHYIIAIPRNLTKGCGVIARGKNKGKKKRGGKERWDDFTDGISTNHPTLKIIRWDENGLLDQLAQTGNQELKRLWFEGELTLSILKEAWKRAKAALGARYLPNLHASNAIEESLSRDTYSKKAFGGHAKLLEEQRKVLAEVQIGLGDYGLAITGASSQVFDSALFAASDRLGEWKEDIGALISQLDRGPLGKLPRLRSANPIDLLHRQLEDRKREKLSGYPTETCLKEVRQALMAFGVVARIEEHLADSRAPRLVMGAPGCGKTHGGAAAVDYHLKDNLPALFIDLKRADPAAGLAPVFREALDTPEWPFGRMLDGLEALAIHAQASVEPEHLRSPFARALIVIDGVEETPGWRAWSEPLRELRVHAQSRPRLHFCVQARPETVARLELPEGFTIQELADDAGVDLEHLLRRYCDYEKG